MTKHVSFTKHSSSYPRRGVGKKHMTDDSGTINWETAGAEGK